MDDTSPSPILARADALMQRRRNHPAEEDDFPVLTTVVEDVEDIPVVNDVIESDTPPEPEVSAQLVSSLVDQVASVVREKLAAEIPSLVEASLQAVVLNLSEDLRQGITETTEQALADFLARSSRSALRKR